MKKKIINGILMVALVGATSTSFVSCKDTSEDVKTDLMAQVNAVKANLEPRVEQAEKDIDALEGRMTTAEGDIKTLKSDVTSLKNRVSTLEQEKDSLAQVTKTIEGQLTKVETKINTIVEALSKMVTSVTVNATSTSILENSKLFPGLNIQFLGTAMGKATTTGKFPSTTTMEGHGTALEAADFAGVKEIYKWSNGDILPKADEDTEVADAGTLWFSLNPSNVVATDLKALKLVDSQGNESFVTINKDSVKVDDETVLSWGVTRGAEFNLWKVQAGINLEATDLATIDPVKIIDYKSIASDVRSMLREIKAAAKTANSSNYASVTKTAAKDVLKNSTQIVASLLKAKVPSLPALALQAQWEDTVGVRSVLSDFSIAATAYKPLSFDFGKDLVEGRTISLDKADKAAAKIIDKVMDKINRAGVKIQAIPEISFDAAYASANLKVYMLIDWDGSKFTKISISNSNATYTTALPGTLPTTAGTYKYYSELDLTNDIKSVTDAIPVAELNALIAEAKQALIDITAFADRTKTFEARVSDFLERELNRVVTKVSTDGLTRILEPIILFQAGENYSVTRFVDGATVPAGEITLIPTTMTNELLAPAFKKYVAVKAADGSFALQSLKTKGDKDFNKLTVNLKAGNYTVIYSALDFYGNQVSKKYDIVVK